VIVIPAPPDLVSPRGRVSEVRRSCPTEHTIVFKSLAPIHPIQYDVALCDMLKEGYSEDRATIRGSSNTGSSAPHNSYYIIPTFYKFINSSTYKCLERPDISIAKSEAHICLD